MKKQSLIVSGLIAAAAALAPTIATAEVNQPQEIIMRPRTTPGGQITLGVNLPILIAPDPIGTAIGLGVTGQYGINDKLEVGVGYGLSLKEFEAKGDLVVGVAYSLVEGNLGVAANLTTGYNILGEVIDPLGIGARIQFRLSDQLAIHSPGSQLVIGLEEPNAMALNLPFGVGFQASPNIYAFVNTSIGTIKIKDSANAFIFADFIPLEVGGFFSPSNAMDFGASIAWFDLKEASDTLAITLMGRLHM